MGASQPVDASQCHKKQRFRSNPLSTLGWKNKEMVPAVWRNFIEAATLSDVKVKTIRHQCIIDRLNIASEKVNKAKKLNYDTSGIIKIRP